MNSFTQDISGLLGSRKSIQELENQENAKLLIVSDSHNNVFALQKILKFKGKESDILIFCGDGVYDIIQILEQAISSKEIQQYIPPVIALCQGNNDAKFYPLKNIEHSSDSTKSSFTQIKIPQIQNFKICNHKGFVLHGHLHSVYSGNEKLLELAKLDNSDLIFYGHTHIATSQLCYPKTLILNPGSCSRPRASQNPCFATLEVHKNNSDFSPIFWQIKGSQIIPYNI